MAIGIGIAAAAPALAQHWLLPGRLTIEAVSSAIAMMGVTLALQWPFTLYSNGLLGLQQQVRLNVAVVIMATIRNAGAVGALWLCGPTIQVYFAWDRYLPPRYSRW